MLPVLVAMAFVQLYRVGNPRFDVLTAGLFDGLFDLLGELLTPHLLFLVFAMMVCAALVRRIAPDAMHRIEHQMTDTLVRTRIRRPRWMRPLSMDPLERERRAGVVLLVLVNIALMVVNVIDISWVWLGFTVPKDFSLKQFVHEGTWALIWSSSLRSTCSRRIARRARSDGTVSPSWPRARTSRPSPSAASTRPKRSEALSTASPSSRCP